MRFCIKCGVELSENKLIRGMCPDCFRKHTSVFKQKPQIEVVVCPKCNSWLDRGEWNPPLPEEEVLRASLKSSLSKHLIEGAELLEVEIRELNRLSATRYQVNAVLELTIDEKPVAWSEVFEIRVSSKTCPSCIARLSGKYNYLIQVRFTRQAQPTSLLNSIKDDLANIIKTNIAILKETREGIDIEVEEAVVARKIMDFLVKHYGARISSSFKQTGYNTRKGKPTGVITYSVRIPVLVEGDIIVYKNRIAVVKQADHNRIVLWMPELDKYESVDIKGYWSGVLKIPVRVEQEEYLVESVGDETLTLKNITTGATKRIRRSSIGHAIGLKPGERLLLIRVDDSIEVFVRPEGLG